MFLHGTAHMKKLPKLSFSTSKIDSIHLRDIINAKTMAPKWKCAFFFPLLRLKTEETFSSLLCTHPLFSTHFSSAYKDLTFSGSEEVVNQWLRISQHVSLLIALLLRFNVVTDSFSSSPAN